MRLLPVLALAASSAGRRGVAWPAALLLAITLITLPAGATPRGLRPPRPSRREAAINASQHDVASSLDSIGRPGLSCSVRSDVLTYHSGSLVANADVFLLFWGAEWQTDQTHLATAQDVITLYQQIGTTGYACSWNEYSVIDQPIGLSTYHGAEVIPSEPPNPLADQTIRDTIVAEVAAGHAPAATDNTVYVVLPPSGVPVDIGGQTGCGGTNFIFCGYHDSFRRNGTLFRYEVLPFPCDSQGGSCFFDPQDDPGRSLQEVGSHELAETVTDPDGDGWNSDRTGDEIADICASSGCDADLVAGQQTLLVNSLWSNLAKGCVDSVPCSPGPVECTDTSPGSCVPGKGAAGGCALEWLVYPNLTFKAATDLPGAQVSCADGQPFCDLDGKADGQCTFQVAACLNSDDPRETCTGATITSVKLSSPLPTSRKPTDSMNAQTILTALSSVDPSVTATVTGAKVLYSPASARPNACTNFFNVVVPVRSVGLRTLAGKRSISPMLQTNAGRGSNRLTLTCNPSFP